MHALAFRFLPIAAVAALLVATSFAPAIAQTAPAPTPDKGDVAWMLIATVLVLLMTIPGLALFYAGLVRAKNVVSMLLQVFAIVCMVAIIWVIYGYSLAFTSGGSLNDYVGGFSKVFLMGVTPESTVATFSNGVVIPELVYICFQMTFACITPALIVGGFAERMKFSALMLFVALWVTFVYFPIAHMVWYWAGPDAVARSRQGALLPLLAREGRSREGTGRRAGRLGPDLPVGRDRLRRRHGGAHQLGHRGPRRRADARQAHRLPPGADDAAQPDPDLRRRRAAVGRLVRLQCRLGARIRRRRRPRHGEHLRRHRRSRACRG